jgi:cytochrome c oxidase assembly factor CtaG
MKWWIRALLATIVLLVFVGGLYLFLAEKIRETTPSAEVAQDKDQQIGAICGQVAGGGTAMVWFLAFVFRKK